MPPSTAPPTIQSSQRVIMDSAPCVIAGIGVSRPVRVATPTGVS